MYRTTALLLGACVAVLSLQANGYAANRLNQSNSSVSGGTNTVCSDGICRSCNGAMSCSGDRCICNGNAVAPNRQRAPANILNQSNSSVSGGTNTVCTDGICHSCNGAMSCSGGRCICSGDAVPAYRVGPCGNDPVDTHPNGGGTVAKSASVDPAAYVSADSAICGAVNVSGPARVINGSLLNGTTRILGRSVIDASIINAASTISNSSIVNSTINNGARITDSEVQNSLFNGPTNADHARIMDSLLQGDASVIGRTVSGAILQ